jgi:hypothetical protein
MDLGEVRLGKGGGWSFVIGISGEIFGLGMTT